MALSLTVLCANGRPDDSKPSDVINVEDTDDEFIIKKPAGASDPSYDKFLEELYRHDEGKKTSTVAAIVKREADQEEAAPEKLTVESPEEFDIPVKPALHQDENYDQFLSHLYRHDEQKNERTKRMIVFRHDD